MEMNYMKGDLVEVEGGEQGLNGSYYIATIVAPSVFVGMLIVAYHTLCNEDGSLLEETVPMSRLRPLPPPSGAMYMNGDHVDIWQNDGWWYDIIEDCPESETYIVNFSHTGYEKEVVSLSEMHPHLHYENGKWYGLMYSGTNGGVEILGGFY